MTTDTEHVENRKKKKSGIIYLSTIPKYMNITKVREIFSTYGKVGRVYLQLAENSALKHISNVSKDIFITNNNNNNKKIKKKA